MRTFKVRLTDDSYYKGIEVGRQRKGTHHPGDNPVRDITGAMGEVGWEQTTGCKMDTSIRKDGDYGVDFDQALNFYGEWIWWILNIHTYIKPYHLLVRDSELEGKTEIFILAGWEEETRTVTFYGWTLASVISKCPLRDFGLGPSHYLHRDDLFDIHMILDRIL